MLQMSIALKVIVSAVCVAQCGVVVVSCSDSGLTIHVQNASLYSTHACTTSAVFHFFGLWKLGQAFETWYSLDLFLQQDNFLYNVVRSSAILILEC